MIEPEHDFKEKPKRRGRNSPVDFVIPLQLDECIYRIEHYPQPDYLEIKVKSITTYGSTLDKRNFAVRAIHKNFVIRCTGTMQRWEGTSTKFYGTAQLKVDPDTRSLWFIFSFLTFIFACFIFQFIPITPAKSHEDLSAVVVISWLVFFALTSVCFTEWSYRKQGRKFQQLISEFLIGQ